MRQLGEEQAWGGSLDDLTPRRFDSVRRSLAASSSGNERGACSTLVQGGRVCLQLGGWNGDQDGLVAHAGGKTSCDAFRVAPLQPADQDLTPGQIKSDGPHYPPDAISEIWLRGSPGNKGTGSTVVALGQARTTRRNWDAQRRA